MKDKDDTKKDTYQHNDTDDASVQRWEKTVAAHFFSNDYRSAFAYKKTQRLVAAVYLVTSLVSENDPIRDRLRSQSMQLFDAVVAHVTGMRTPQGHMEHTVLPRIFALISELELAHTTRTISAMNAAVLSREFAALHEHFTSAHTQTPQRGVFDTHFFDVSRWYADTALQENTASDDAAAADTANRERAVQHSTASKQGEQAAPNTDPRGARVRSGADAKAHARTEQSSNNKQRSSERQELILDVVRKKGRVNIKDISQVVVDCSEKTIQRELAALVQNGTLKKEGERRWSTYALAAR